MAAATSGLVMSRLKSKDPKRPEGCQRAKRRESWRVERLTSKMRQGLGFVHGGKNLQSPRAGRAEPEMTPPLNVTINLSPSPGFCIKSKLLQPGALNVTSTQNPVPIPQGLKVFVNIAWSKDVPPPLDGVEKALEYAAHNRRMDGKSQRESPISVLTFDGRLDTDKGTSISLYTLFARARLDNSRIFDMFQDLFADPGYHIAGKPALVFDCIYNSSLKHHASKDAEFKNFLMGTCTRQFIMT